MNRISSSLLKHRFKQHLHSPWLQLLSNSSHRWVRRFRQKDCLLAGLLNNGPTTDTSGSNITANEHHLGSQRVYDNLRKGLVGYTAPTSVC